MAALTAAKSRPYAQGSKIGEAIPVAASQTIYKGSIIMIGTSDGAAYDGANTGSMKYYGIAKKNYASTTAGAVKIEVDQPTEAYFSAVTTAGAAGGAVQAGWIGVDVYVYDDDSVALAAVATNTCKVGRCTAVDADGLHVWVECNYLA